MCLWLLTKWIGLELYCINNTSKHMSYTLEQSQGMIDYSLDLRYHKKDAPRVTGQFRRMVLLVVS